MTNEQQYLADLEKYHAYYKLALVALVRKNGGTLAVELGPEATTQEAPALRHIASTREDGVRILHFDLVGRKK